MVDEGFAGAGGRGGDGGEDGVPELKGGGEGFFVRGDDTDAGVEEVGVGVGEGLIGGVVGEDGGAGGGGEVFDQVWEGLG